VGGRRQFCIKNLKLFSNIPNTFILSFSLLDLYGNPSLTLYFSPHPSTFSLVNWYTHTRIPRNWIDFRSAKKIRSWLKVIREPFFNLTKKIKIWSEFWKLLEMLLHNQLVVQLKIQLIQEIMCTFSYSQTMAKLHFAWTTTKISDTWYWRSVGIGDPHLELFFITTIFRRFYNDNWDSGYTRQIKEPG
jgi:hypothetical protein